jgi:hypothetical protein
MTLEGGGFFHRHLPLRWGIFRLSKSHFGHALHVSLLRLDQAEQLLPGLFDYVAGAAGEKASEPCVKCTQPVGDIPKELLGTTALLWYRRIVAALAGAIRCLFAGRQDIHARVQYASCSILSRTLCANT